MELSDLLSDELLAFCSDDTEREDIDTLFASAFDVLEFEAIPAPTPISVIPALTATQCQTSSTPNPSAHSATVCAA